LICDGEQICRGSTLLTVDFVIACVFVLNLLFDEAQGDRNLGDLRKLFDSGSATCRILPSRTLSDVFLPGVMIYQWSEL